MKIKTPSLSAIFAGIAALSFPACATNQSGDSARYYSALEQNTVEEQQLVAMSDDEVRQQRAGTTRTRQTARSETSRSNGEVQREVSTEETTVTTTAVERVIDMQPVVAPNTEVLLD